MAISPSIPPETGADRLQGAAMALFLAAGFALAVVAIRTPAAHRQLDGTLDLKSAIAGRTAGAVNHVMSHYLPIDAVLREAGGVLRWRLFGSGGPQVWVGRDNWLFLIEELRPYSDAAAAMEFRIAVVQRIRDRLAARGIALVVAVVPDKARIVAAEMDGPRSAQAASRYADLEHLLGRAKIPFVNLRDSFAAHLPAQDLYYRTDTHWSQSGAAIAARDIAAAIAVPLDRNHDFQTLPDAQATPLTGDLLRLMSLDRIPDDLPVPLRPPADQQRVEHTKDLSPPPASGGLLDDGPQVEVALIGSSYSLNANFAGRLAEAIKAPIGNFAQAGGAFAGSARAYFTGDTFKEAVPKLVIWEFPERVMGQPLGEDDNVLYRVSLSMDASANKP